MNLSATVVFSMDDARRSQSGKTWYMPWKILRQPMPFALPLPSKYSSRRRCTEGMSFSFNVSPMKTCFCGHCKCISLSESIVHIYSFFSCFPNFCSCVAKNSMQIKLHTINLAIKVGNWVIIYVDFANYGFVGRLCCRYIFQWSQFIKFTESSFVLSFDG